ncbi:MAG: hypothetical protein V3S93_07620 [Methyloceanibacter sp.]|jgi:hypothetical protein
MAFPILTLGLGESFMASFMVRTMGLKRQARQQSKGHGAGRKR